jgi:hypothetical protein
MVKVMTCLTLMIEYVDDLTHLLLRGGTDSLARDVSESHVGPTRDRAVVLTRWLAT